MEALLAEQRKTFEAEKSEADSGKRALRQAKEELAARDSELQVALEEAAAQRAEVERLTAQLAAKATAAMLKQTKSGYKRGSVLTGVHIDEESDVPVAEQARAAHCNSLSLLQQPNSATFLIQQFRHRQLPSDSPYLVTPVAPDQGGPSEERRSRHRPLPGMGY